VWDLYVKKWSAWWVKNNFKLANKNNRLKKILHVVIYVELQMKKKKNPSPLVCLQKKKKKKKKKNASLVIMAAVTLHL
jgi:hypothetical protein